MLGVVNLDKPVGPTSHDMVGLLRRLTGTRRIGHAGTLDPLASGVLPILVGAATRFSGELTAGEKQYEAVIRLGQRSATDDAEGPISDGGAVPPDAAIRAALATFSGVMRQRPPNYSARSHRGVRAHRAARAGEAIELPERSVTISRLDVIAIRRAADTSKDVTIDLRCGPGTYVRALARDLGELLGCGGYLLALRRTEASRLRVADARTPGELEQLTAAGRLAEAVIPVETLIDLPALRLDAAAAWRFAHGAAVRLDEPPPEGARHLVFGDGTLIGVGMVAGQMLTPDRVIPPERPPA